MPSAIACVAVLGPDNVPLLIQKIADELQRFEFDMVVFCALDGFEHQTGQRKATLRGTDRFFGPAQPAEGQRLQVWGYRANLGYKIVVLTIAQPPVSEGAVRGFCEKVKDAVFDRILDPFYRPFSQLDSRALTAKVAREADAIQQPQI